MYTFLCECVVLVLGCVCFVVVVVCVLGGLCLSVLCVVCVLH